MKRETIDHDQTRMIFSDKVAIRHSKFSGRYYVETWHGRSRPHWHSVARAVYSDFRKACERADVLRRKQEGLL